MRKLRFIRVIGAGAFGTVYLCELTTPRGFRRNVALKVLRDQADAGMFLSRIRDEARLLGLLQDGAIIKVMDLIEVKGRQAVLMEYVEGADLESIVEQHGPPPPRALAEIGAVVAGALSRAHLAVHPTTEEPLNVIHRDVKPANVIISQAGAVKLLDFGVARARFDARESYTGQLVLGTLNYMAPEYVVTGEVTPAADVYGLGLTLWQSATGAVYGQPKVRRNDHEARLDERLSQLPPDFVGLESFLRHMLCWSPEKRPSAASIEEWLDEGQSQLPGPGLRAWARDTIGTLLEARPSPNDEAGLIGMETVLADPLVGDFNETRGADTTPRTPEDVPTAKHPPSTWPELAVMGDQNPSGIEDPVTEELELTASDEITSRTTEPGTRRNRTEGSAPNLDTTTPVSEPSRIRNPIVKGMLMGAGVGLLILITLALLQSGSCR